MTHDPMDCFLAQLASDLRSSTTRGATLAALTLAAACGSATRGGATGSGGSPGDGGAQGGTLHSGGATGGEAGATGGDAGSGQLLQPYPTTGLGCFGPFHNDGYYGQCCYAASCYTPPEGEKCSASADRSILPPGSGSCSCEENGQPDVSGPYAPNPTHVPLQAGPCCYLIGSIACEGRPFFVDGQLLLADVVARDDWGIRA